MQCERQTDICESYCRSYTQYVLLTTRVGRNLVTSQAPNSSSRSSKRMLRASCEVWNSIRTLNTVLQFCVVVCMKSVVSKDRVTCLRILGLCD